jgi:hypothetical protein
MKRGGPPGWMGGGGTNISSKKKSCNLTEFLNPLWLNAYGLHKKNYVITWGLPLERHCRHYNI